MLISRVAKFSRLRRPELRIFAKSVDAAADDAVPQYFPIAESIEARHGRDKSATIRNYGEKERTLFIRALSCRSMHACRSRQFHASRHGNCSASRSSPRDRFRFAKFLPLGSFHRKQSVTSFRRRPTRMVVRRRCCLSRPLLPPPFSHRSCISFRARRR